MEVSSKGILACILNSIIWALIALGIEMNDTLLVLSCGIDDSNQVIVDLN